MKWCLSFKNLNVRNKRDVRNHVVQSLSFISKETIIDSVCWGGGMWAFVCVHVCVLPESYKNKEKLQNRISLI